ncbi:MAG: acyl-CoA thioesterase, partial [Campylobacteraceae bacterium]|nr:acyl-CoA thioesterase [Campylobacteraceae bacterium]
VKIGDTVTCYGKIIKIGKTSIQTQIEVFAERVVDHEEVCVHVTSAIVTYVAVDNEGSKRALKI